MRDCIFLVYLKTGHLFFCIASIFISVHCNLEKIMFEYSPDEKQIPPAVDPLTGNQLLQNQYYPESHRLVELFFG